MANKDETKTLYCCNTILDVSVAKPIANILNEYIDDKKFEEAIKYIKLLALIKTSEDKLIRCVETYKRSC